MNANGLMNALGEPERLGQGNRPGEADTAVIDTPELPSDKTNRLRTKAYFLPPGILPLLDVTMDIIASAANAPASLVRNLSNMVFRRSPAWVTFPNPYTTSTYLAHFTAEHNARSLNRAVSGLGNFPTERKAPLQAILSARAEARRAGGGPEEDYDGLGDLVAMYPSLMVEDGALQKRRLQTGLEQAPQYMMEHDHTLCGSPAEIESKHSIQAPLTTHVDAWNNGENVDPLGGRLKLSKYGYSKRAETVELSRGTEPTSTFEVPNLTASLSTLATVPNTTKWLTTLSAHYRHFILSFDLSQPTSPVSLAGHAPGAAVKRLVTHEDMPTSFIAAGGDALVRIYDFRDQEPQVSLDGHTKVVNSCTVAPSGGRFPVVFTGGEDELVKAWDIRYSKSCLYSLSSGTLEVVQLAWSDSGNSLFMLGKNPHIGYDGRHHGYREADRVPNPSAGPVGEESGEEFDENTADEPAEAEWWPLRSMTPQNFFGKRYCEVKHSVLEYRFKENANIGIFPSSEEPDIYHGYQYW